MIRLLCIQVTNPIIFIVLPLIAAIICAVTGVKLSMMPVQIGMLLFTIYPCFNAVITIISITPYYEFTKNWIKK
uniref:Uncharacterized protein n=1 Tax=Panagrolaimus sp. JU765 TaxID=591449 RepID=A0AC34Q1L5_9BILA